MLAGESVQLWCNFIIEGFFECNHKILDFSCKGTGFQETKLQY